MDGLRRLAPLTGAGAVVLLLAAAALVGFYEYLPDPDRIRTTTPTTPGASSSPA